MSRNVLRSHTLPRPHGLIEVDFVVDIGAGIRPMQWYAPKRHLCVEPFGPYADVLVENGVEVVRQTAAAGLRDLKESGGCDAVYMLDVIEHMAKPTALDAIGLAVEVARKQVVIFTPYGFMRQTEDAWGMGGETWQTHRSGWLPSDFSWRFGHRGWDTQMITIEDGPPCFFAVLTK